MKRRLYVGQRVRVLALCDWSTETTFTLGDERTAPLGTVKMLRRTDDYAWGALDGGIPDALDEAARILTNGVLALTHPKHCRAVRKSETADGERNPSTVSRRPAVQTTHTNANTKGNAR